MLTTSGYPNGASLRSSIDDSPQDQNEDESETFLLGMVTGDGLGKVHFHSDFLILSFT